MTVDAQMNPQANKQTNAQAVFWDLAGALHARDPRVVEGTIMSGRCLRVGQEFLALVDYKGSGLVVKLPRARVAALIASGEGQPFAPAQRVFAEWVSVPKVDAKRWAALLDEGVAFVAGAAPSTKTTKTASTKTASTKKASTKTASTKKASTKKASTKKASTKKASTKTASTKKASTKKR